MEKKFSSIKQPKSYELIFNQIKESIIKGVFKPGDKLPSESDLVTQFQVSRHVVREALRSLQTAGFIEIKQGAYGGAVVLEMNFELLSGALSDMLRLGKISISQLTEVRKSLETEVARLAAKRATTDDLNKLSATLIEEPIMNFKDRIKESVTFHHVLSLCSHNPIYTIMMDSLLDLIHKLIIIVKPEKEILPGKVTHKMIYEAVRMKDEKKAVELIIEHMSKTASELKKYEEKYIKENFNKLDEQKTGLNEILKSFRYNFDHVNNYKTI
ncbi:MAG: FadR family transcriptional regulator [Deltaproteobacteria bacterium]|nr:FadR family transcriptional regulator [Deltaproteobacteria bacterium]